MARPAAASTTERERAGAAWKRSLAAAVRDPDELLEALDLPRELREPARRAAREFPLVVPREFIARMRRGDPSDPLLRQVLPLGSELEAAAGFQTDPLGEAHATRAPGLLEKYAGRVLLIATGACAVHCRYCFRRHFPYEGVPNGLSAWEPALARIAEDTSLREVILSGGDPLVLTDTVLARLAERLRAVPHLRRMRVHTRLPIVIPSRVDAGLLSWLADSRLTPIVVVHANHPNEIDEACAAALSRLVDAGIPVLNQTVLLRGVNDDAVVLQELCERLVDLRVLPYYLHQLDPVSGAARFLVPLEEGRAIAAELARRLPGYAVPRYVQELPGREHKVPL